MAPLTKITESAHGQHQHLFKSINLPFQSFFLVNMDKYGMVLPTSSIHVIFIVLLWIDMA